MYNNKIKKKKEEIRKDFSRRADRQPDFAYDAGRRPSANLLPCAFAVTDIRISRSGSENPIIGRR